MSTKPIKAKPQFYAVCLLPMQEIARKMGYNLVVHGSMDRDFDLVAIPWVDNPEPEIKLIQKLDFFLRGTFYDDESAKFGYMHSQLLGGRSSYVINLNRMDKWGDYVDHQFYLDISITPLKV